MVNARQTSAHHDVVPSSEMPDWDLYEKAYQGMQRAGISHDTASDKALSLALMRKRVDHPNYGFVGRRAEINVSRRRDNSRCDPFSTPMRAMGEGEPLTLGDTLRSGPEHDPEQVVLMKETFRLIPDDIMRLFTERTKPLTGSESSRLHRFRERARQKFLGNWPGSASTAKGRTPRSK